LTGLGQFYLGLNLDDSLGDNNAVSCCVCSSKENIGSRNDCQKAENKRWF
jgi:hypothetical protein